MLLRIPRVLDAGAIGRIREALQNAPFVDGSGTASAGARGIKRNLQIPTDGEAMRVCAPIVLEALRASATFFSAALPGAIDGPLFNRYDAGMSYGGHIDTSVSFGAATRRRDVSVTVFLSEPGEYDGGDLVIHDSFGAHRVKLDAGSAIVYPASSLHQVDPVTRGTRLAAILWVQSLVRDEARRRVLFDLDFAIGSIAAERPGAAELATLTSTYHNLLRMWAEP